MSRDDSLKFHVFWSLGLGVQKVDEVKIGISQITIIVCDIFLSAAARSSRLGFVTLSLRSVSVFIDVFLSCFDLFFD